MLALKLLYRTPESKVLKKTLEENSWIKLKSRTYVDKEVHRMIHHFHFLKRYQKMCCINKGLLGYLVMQGKKISLQTRKIKGSQHKLFPSYHPLVLNGTFVQRY